jgi:hypothetical protein
LPGVYFLRGRQYGGSSSLINQSIFLAPVYLQKAYMERLIKLTVTCHGFKANYTTREKKLKLLRLNKIVVGVFMIVLYTLAIYRGSKN